MSFGRERRGGEGAEREGFAGGEERFVLLGDLAWLRLEAQREIADLSGRCNEMRLKGTKGFRVDLNVKFIELTTSYSKHLVK